MPPNIYYAIIPDINPYLLYNMAGLKPTTSPEHCLDPEWRSGGSSANISRRMYYLHPAKLVDHHPISPRSNAEEARSTPRCRRSFVITQLVPDRSYQGSDT